MSVIQTQPKQTKDMAARSYSVHASLSKRGADLAKSRQPGRVTVPEEANPLAPSPYTVLVSRIENRGSADASAAAKLADWLEVRLPRLSDPSLRRIAQLPETAAAGLSPEPATFAKQIVARLRQGPVAQAMLALLKHPVFAAYMKDQQVRVAMYGPQGSLRAS